MPDDPTIPDATCPPFSGASARDLLAGILLASGGDPANIPNTTQCREWGYGRYTERDLLAAILLAIESGGGGGGPFLPLAGGAMDENAIVTLDNNSQWRQSTPDIGIAGSEGFSIVCGVGYEYKFAAGYLFVLNNTSTQVRQVLYAPTTPSVNDDITLGYVVGTTWETAGGIKYICSDATATAAVWDLVPSGGNPFDQDLNTTDDVGFKSILLESYANGEMLRLEGNAVAGNDVGFAVYNNTGNNANSFWFNQNAAAVGIGVEENVCRIYADLPLVIILPTDNTNLPSGSIWNDAGVISLVP